MNDASTTPRQGTVSTISRTPASALRSSSSSRRNSAASGSSPILGGISDSARWSNFFFYLKELDAALERRCARFVQTLGHLDDHVPEQVGVVRSPVCQDDDDLWGRRSNQ
jgi:hypothetical protein